MTKELVKLVEASEKITTVKQKPKDRENNNKKDKKPVIIEKAWSKELNFDYIEELKTQLTYGDTGHGLLLDKKV